MKGEGQGFFKAYPSSRLNGARPKKSCRKKKSAPKKKVEAMKAHRKGKARKTINRAFLKAQKRNRDRK